MKKLFLVILCLILFSTIWSCLQSWPVPRSRADIAIGEMYSGATWSVDSQKVYFLRWVNFGSAGQLADKEKSMVDDKFKVLEKITSICPWLAPWIVPVLMGNVPGPLYNKVIVYSYDFATKTVQIVAILPYTEMSPVFFFSDSVIDNKISFCSGGGAQIHSVDLSTGQDVPIQGNCQFLKRGAHITVETPNFEYTDRYLSPDRHSFIEFPSNILAPKVIKIFHDPSVYMMTMAELGSDENLAATTASIEEIKAWQANMAKILTYQATEKISSQQLDAPEERQIKKRFGI